MYHTSSNTDKHFSLSKQLQKSVLNKHLLHGPPVLVDNTNFGSIITPTFIGLRKHLAIGQLNEYQFFSVFHW